MSRYTIDVRYICEAECGLSESVGYNDIDSVIEQAYPHIFKKFPIFDESYRKTLCCNILRHFYMREIACETVGLWKFWLNEKMGILMPRFNKIYLAYALEFSPLVDVDYTRSGNRLGKENEILENKHHDTTTNDYNEKMTQSLKERYSDTPQGGLSGIESNTYLTNATLNDNVISTDNTGTIRYHGDKTDDRDKTATEDYTETIKGKRGSDSYIQMLKEYYEKLVNVDELLFNELEDLFMCIW